MLKMIYRGKITPGSSINPSVAEQVSNLKRNQLFTMRKKQSIAHLFVFGLLLLCFAFLSEPVQASTAAAIRKPAVSQSVNYQYMPLDGVNVHVITVNLDDQRVRITPAFSPGYSEGGRNYPRTTMNRMYALYGPTAIINGTFFDSRTSKTVCNVAINGKLVCEGDRGSTIFVDNNNKPGMILTSQLRGRNLDWSRYKWAVQSGPTLIYNGQIIVNPQSEGFTDPSLFRQARRSAAGITRSGKLIFVSTGNGASFHQIARIMQRLDAVYALCLDGGNSVGMGYLGNYPVKPNRTLPNFIMIYADGSKKRTPDYPDVTQIIHNRKVIIANQLKRKAEALLQKNDIPSALNYYQKACQELPGNMEFILASARVLERVGRPKVASRYYGKAAVQYLEMGEAPLADTTAKNALTLDNSNNYAREVLDILSKHPEYAQATRKITSNNLDQAEKIIIELARTNNNPRFYQALARIYARKGEFEREAQMHYLCSLAFSGQENRRYEAYLSAKQAVESNPSCREYRYLLARTAAGIGNHGAANYHRFTASRIRKSVKDFIDVSTHDFLKGTLE